MEESPVEKCITCGKDCTAREGRVCDKCYTPAFVAAIQDGDDE
jgi:NMD protein affecting ribosome stability and mRNA decay